jgi:hypothetical protein
MAESSSIKFRRFLKTIPANTTQDLDSNSVSTFKGVKYLLKAWGSSKVKELEMNVVRSDASLSDSVFGKVGTLPLSVDAVEDSGSVVLRVQNSNNFDIQTEVIKLLLSQ